MDATISFGRAIASDLPAAEAREWLVTNGIGGYASGTVAGSISRGYHGLLVAALRPPVDRRLMCVKLDDTVSYRGGRYDLATNRWASGAVAPTGLVNIERFSLDGSVPTWRYTFGDVVIEKRIWMEHGENTTWVSWTVVSASEAIELSARAVVDNRVFHNTGSTAWPATVTAVEGGVEVVSGGDGARRLLLQASAGNEIIKADRYDDFLLPAELRRGLRATDDHVHAADLTTSLVEGDTWLVLASAEDSPADRHGALDRRQRRDRDIIESWERTRADGHWPEWAAQLVLAADQFVVERRSGDDRSGRSVIAGYHWFEDWGRDTMISLPGLTLTTGRHDTAAEILGTFAEHVSEGMLPNRFPDGSDTPQYNTIDATLWYFVAIRAYVDATGDLDLVRRLWPTLASIVECHVGGTRFGIQVDPADGLLRGGQPGVQLTWMDAKVGDRVITPRIGKPVEVNALWINALAAMRSFAEAIGESTEPYDQGVEAATQGFQRFWNDALGCCYDVLDGPDGHDPALRPNQLLAISLPVSPLTAEQQHKVLAVCTRMLLTSHGLRSLSPDDPAYVGRYRGDQPSRDGAYHQGTVWAWLLGPFIDAHLRMTADADSALRMLEPLGDHLSAAGLGTISEIFDGNAPFAPRGCIAQAWSVGELLRVVDRLVRERKR